MKISDLEESMLRNVAKAVAKDMTDRITFFDFYPGFYESLVYISVMGGYEWKDTKITNREGFFLVDLRRKRGHPVKNIRIYFDPQNMPERGKSITVKVTIINQDLSKSFERVLDSRKDNLTNTITKIWKENNWPSLVKWIGRNKDYDETVTKPIGMFGTPVKARKS